MFKGSRHFDPRLGRGTADIIEAKGAVMNATTWNDRTNYYELVEPEHIPEILSLEADRMRYLLLREDDLAAEMVVVRNEYERWKNDPLQQLSYRLWEKAFDVHPYRYPTIGSREDIEGTNVAELKEFYDTFYWPNNATVTVAGDIDETDVLTHVAKAFEHLPNGALPVQTIPQEPKQTTEKFLEYTRQGTVSALGLGYKIPAGSHASIPSLTVLAALLHEGKGSLFHGSLIDTSQATNVHGMLSRFYDPGLLEVLVVLNEGVKHEDVYRDCRTHIEAVAKGEYGDQAFERARAFASADALYERAALSDYMHAINESIALGDWKDAISLPSRIAAVTRKDVEEVAREYLQPESLTRVHMISKP